MSRYAWVTNDAERDADCAKIHATGCAHLSRIGRQGVVRLAAATLAEAVAEAGEQDCRDDPNSTGNPADYVTVMPCARKAQQ